ncbi:MAG: arginine--tRNA ligase [Thermotogota bacterium]|nr:arginine--tRNA ligase [Thermotogota bacterium]
MLRKKLYSAIESVLNSFSIENIPDFTVEIPPEGMGDFSTNVAFLLTKERKKNPRKIAEEIVSEISSFSFIKECNIAGPGFINFTLNNEVYRETLINLLERPEFWKEKGKIKILFEFGSANPTGPITIGHGRQLVFGDVLSTVFESQGYYVSKEMYMNDAGRQIKLLGKSLWARYMQLIGEDEKIPEDGYKGEYLIEIAKIFREKYGEIYKKPWTEESGEKFSEFALKSIQGEIQETLSQLRVQFDSAFSEKSLIENNEVIKILNTLKEKGLTYEKDAALWLKVSSFEDEKDKVLVRSDGTYTYFLTDIAYHFNKYKRGYEIACDIWGPDHSGHIKRMYAAMKALGLPEGFLRIVIHQYVNIKQEDKIVKMSTRKGEFVTLKKLLDTVGTDAARYFFAMFDPDTHMDFDIELAKKKSSENPVYYIQYAHARISSIFEKAARENISVESCITDNYEFNEEEKKIIKQISGFKDVLKKITSDFKTNRLTSYLEQLAGTYHAFYNKHIVVDPTSPDVSLIRLELSRLVKRTIAQGLSLLGVSAPESM